MREQTLRGLSSSLQWWAIDTDKGFRQSRRLWRTIAFRLKAGPLVDQINQEVIEQTRKNHYDLIWVDKGVYLWEKTIRYLRRRTDYMIHFTPDTAFHANRSRHFFSAAQQYDLLVTTKSFELEKYYEIADEKKIYLTTQAYDARLHKRRELSTKRKSAAVFIGLCEPDREGCIETLLAADIPVRVGGRGWKRFVNRHSNNPKFHFLGSDIIGGNYVCEYTSASVGLGLLSKRFPELHTTRTFEIPASGTMLATERTVDTENFFQEDEVLFFDNYKQLAVRLIELLKTPGKIEEIAEKGYQRVTTGGYDYNSVLSAVLNNISIQTGKC